MEAQAVEVGAKARLGAADAEVTQQRQSQAATDGWPLHRRHHRLAAGEQAQRLAVQWVDGARAALRGRGIAVFEIGAGAKRRPLRRQHDGAARAVGLEVFKGIGQSSDERDVEEIVRRAAHLDRGDMAIQADVDVGVAHGLILCSNKKSEAKSKPRRDKNETKSETTMRR